MTAPDETPDPFAAEAAPREGSFAELGFSGLLFVVGLAFYLQARGINSDAEIWPRSLALVLTLLAAAQFARSALLRVRHGSPRIPLDLPAFARRAFTAVWLLVYCLAAPLVGFGLAMVVLMPVYMWAAGFRRPVLIVLVTLLSAAAITMLFGTVAGVPVWEADL